MNSLVSVIIPTFNRAHVLPRAIESVLSQTYKNIELIVVDDGSSDDTKLLSVGARYFYQENKGVSAARNLGIEKARGEYIAFLDSDDKWHPEKIQKQISFFKKNTHLNLVHTNEVWIRNGVKVNPPKKYKKDGGDQFLRCLNLCVISPSTVMVKATIFDRFGAFREDYPVCEDFDLWLKITAVEEVGFLPEYLIDKYGGDEDQLSSKYFAMDYWRIKSLKDIFDKHSDQKYIDSTKINEVIKTIQSKSRVLLKGYIKHNNLKHFDEINSILREIDAVSPVDNTSLD